MKRPEDIINRAAADKERRRLLQRINRPDEIERQRQAQGILRAHEVRPSLASRREFMKGASLGAGFLYGAMMRSNRALATHARGGGSLSLPGFYPASHWIASKQSAIKVYPVQDGSTNTWAPHQFAYWDGTTGIQYRKTIGVSFGAFPYVFILMAGPPGMTIQAGIWNSAWNCQGAGVTSGTGAAVDGFGKVLWTPTGAVTGQSNNVWVRVYSQDLTYVDVIWTLNTAGDITAGGPFAFVDNVHGSNSNPGTKASPYDSLTTACGSTFSAVKNAGAILYLRNSGTAYAMPPYSDNNLDTTKPYFEIGKKGATLQKPVGIFGYPGETMTLDGTTAMLALSGGDVVVQDVAFNGYISSSPPAGFSSVANYQLITHNGGRQTLDGVTWTNGGYGTTGTNVPAMALSNGAGQGAWKNLFHTGLADLSHESGNPGNNYSGSCLYSNTNSLIQFSEAVSPTATSDGAWYFKGADESCCVRGNLVNFSGCVHACDFGQAGGGGSGDSQSNESCYNTCINVNFMEAPQVSGTGPEWMYRNNLLVPGTGHPGMTSGTPNANGPWVFDSNAVQVASPSGAQPPTGTSVQTDGLNLFVSSGLLNSDGTLAVAYSTSVGLVGAQIA